jgi:hypothetical protein
MASWASKGHNARRRAGLPSNHLESAGAGMNRSHITSDEAHEMAGQMDSARVPMGMDAYAPCGTCGSEPCQCGNSTDELGTNQFSGMMMPRHNTQAGDPTYPGSKQNRVNVYERMGAQYRVDAQYGAVIDPSVGPTQANGAIVPSVAGRQNPNFQSGEQYSYI